MGGRARVDCILSDIAVEIDFSDKWAEGLAQAMFYAQRLDKTPRSDFGVQAAA